MKFSTHIFETLIESSLGDALAETPCFALLTEQIQGINACVCASVFSDWQMGRIAFQFGNDGRPYYGQCFGIGFDANSTINAVGSGYLYDAQYLNQGGGGGGAPQGYHAYGTKSSIPSPYSLIIPIPGFIVPALPITFPAEPADSRPPFPASAHDGEVFCPAGVGAVYVSQAYDPVYGAGSFWPASRRYILGPYPPVFPPPSPPPPPNYFYNGFAVYPFAGKCSLMISPNLTPGTIGFHPVRGDGVTLGPATTVVVTDFPPGAPVDPTWGTCTRFPFPWINICTNAIYIPANSGGPKRLTLPVFYPNPQPLIYPNAPVMNNLFNYGASDGRAITFWYLRNPDELPTEDFNPAAGPWNLLPQF